MPFAIFRSRVVVPGRASWPRRVIETLVLIAIAGGMSSTLLVEGWLAPEVVSSGSMAPALLGPHGFLRCDVCGAEFECDAFRDGSAPAVCPNCGWPQSHSHERLVAGDRILIDRATLGSRPIRRWDMMVFRRPQPPHEYAVKRVAGLPGEAVEIHDGHVYIDGAIARHDLAEQRAEAILVHDTAHWPDDARLPPRWHADPVDSWRSQPGGGCRHEKSAKSPAANKTDWLRYFHWKRGLGDPATIEDAPLTDDDSYNPDTSRKLNEVDDVMLVAQLSTAGPGDLYVQVGPEGADAYRIEITPATGRILVRHNQAELARRERSYEVLQKVSELVVTTFDGELAIALDGEVLATVPWRREHPPAAEAFGIGAAGLEVDVRRLQIWRGIYYTSPQTVVDTSPRLLGPDEYFVLGDNSPVSVDSRPWTGGETIAERLFVGRAFFRIRRDPVSRSSTD